MPMTVTAQSRADAPRIAPAPWRVVAAIAGAEARRMAFHPVLWLGVGVSIFIALAEAYRWDGFAVFQAATEFGLLMTPLVLAVVVVAHAAASRGARHDVGQVVNVAPTSAVVRRLGVTLGLAGPALMAVALMAGLTTWMRLAGAIGWPRPLDVVGTVAWVLLGGLVGIVAARLTRSLMVGPLAGIGLVVVSVYLSNEPSPVTRLDPAQDWNDLFTAIEWAPRSPGLHLVWVVGLCLLLLAVIVAAGGTFWATMATGVAGLAAASTAAIMLTSVWTPARIDAYITAHADPGAVSDCSEFSDLVVWCAPSRRYDQWGHQRVAMSERVQELLAGIAVVPQRRFQLVGHTNLRTTMPRQAQADPRWGAPLAQPGVVPVSVGQGSATLETAASMIGSLLLEVTPGALPGDVRLAEPMNLSSGGAAPDGEMAEEPDPFCSMAGQSRGAVVLALASVALDRPIDPVARPYSVHGLVLEPELGVMGYGHPALELIRVDGIGVEMPPETVHVAAGLAAGPATIDRLIDERERWLDPTATLDELVAAFDLPAPPTLRSAIIDAGVPANHPDLDAVVDDYQEGIVRCL